MQQVGLCCYCYCYSSNGNAIAFFATAIVFFISFFLVLLQLLGDGGSWFVFFVAFHD